MLLPSGLLLIAIAASPPPPAVIIWGGGKTEADAERSLATWRSVAPGTDLSLVEGYPRIVESSRWKGLRPGFFVVVLGVCRAKDLGKVIRRLKPDNPGVYARSAPGLEEPPACPRVAERKTIKPQSLAEARQHRVSIPPGFTGGAEPEIVSSARFRGKLVSALAGDVAVQVGWDSCARPEEEEEEGEPRACASGEELRVFRGKRLILQLPHAADYSDAECSQSLALRNLKSVARAKGEPPAIVATYDWSDGGCAALYAADACASEDDDAREACLADLPASEREDRLTFVWREGAYVQDSREEGVGTP